MITNITGTITEEYVRKVIRPRPRDMHKGDCGHVLVIAGSAGMTGAAWLAAGACLRTGSGLVYVCTPKANFSVIQTLAPEAICIEWDEALRLLSEDNTNTGRHFSGYDAVAFGPGVGTGMQSKRRMKALLMTYGGPLVLDADGLNLIAGDDELKELVRSYPGEIVMTPHAGEAVRLLQIRETGDLKETETRRRMASYLEETYGVTVVLKGAGTLVAGRETEDGVPRFVMYENTTGNPGMASAGSGDVLTGVITSLAGQGIPVTDAAKTGVWIHGRAGDLAAADLGEYGMIAGDILRKLPAALKPFGER